MFSRRCLPPFVLLLMGFSSSSAPPAESLPDGTIARLGDGWLRHKEFVLTAAFSPDGKTLVTADLNALYVWDLAAKHCQRLTPLKPPDGIRALRFSRDGKTLFAGCRFGAIRALDPEKKFAVQFTLEERGRSSLVFRGLEVTDDGKTLMTVNDQQGSVILWDVDKREVRQRFAGDRGFPAAALTRDGKQLIQARDDGSLHVWDVASGKKTRTIEAPAADRKQPNSRRIGHLAGSPNGRMLAVVRGDQTVGMYSLGTGETVWRLGVSNYARTGLTFSPDGRTLAVIDEQDISLRDAATGKERRRVPSPGGGAKALVFSPDSKTLAAVGPHQGVRLWDATTGKLSQPPVGHTSSVMSLRFLPDGKRLASAAAELIVWDVATAKVLQRQPVSPYVGSLTVDREGQTLHFLADGAVCSWRPGGDGEIQRRPLSPSSLPQLVLSPGGERLAAMTSQEELYVQDLHGEQKKRTLEAPRIYHSWLNFSPDGRLLAAVGRDNTIRLWSAAAGKRLRELKLDEQPTPYISRLAFTGDGRSLVVMTTALDLIEIASGKKRARFPLFPGPLHAFAFSRDGRFVAIPHPEGKILVYATATRQQLAELPAHQGDIWSLAFSDDGRLLASGGVLATILVWKMPKGDKQPAVENAGQAAELWEQLPSANAPRAYRALARLANSPDRAVSLVKASFQTVWKRPNPARLRQHLADLDSDSFEVREQASHALVEAGPDVVELLHKTLSNKPSPEVKRRIEDILHGLKERGSEQLRSLRALEVLERIGTPQARELLRELAAKPLPEELHEDIEASLRRMDARAPAASRRSSTP